MHSLQLTFAVIANTGTSVLIIPLQIKPRGRPWETLIELTWATQSYIHLEELHMYRVNHVEISSTQESIHTEKLTQTRRFIHTHTHTPPQVSNILLIHLNGLNSMFD